MVKINDKIMAMPHCGMMMRMAVRLWSFPSFMVVLVVCVMDMQMGMILCGMIVFQVAQIIGGPHEITCYHRKRYKDT